MTRLKPKVVAYIAQEAVRRYGNIEPRLPEKLQRNIRRRFEVTVPRDELLRLAEHYKAMYGHASAALPKFLTPPKGRYVDASDVRIPAFLAALARRYPKESELVINTVAWYTVHYEYLR